MKTIYKYQAEISDYVSARMPVGAEVLCVQMQAGTACIWALVDTLAPKEDRLFRWYGTGHRIHDESPGRYVGTIQLDAGALVFHLFEVVQ